MTNTLYYGSNLRVRRKYAPSAHDLAYASGADCAEPKNARERRQRLAGRIHTAVAEFHRLYPCPNDVKCELCKRELKSEAASGGNICVCSIITGFWFHAPRGNRLSFPTLSAGTGDAERRDQSFPRGAWE